MVKLQDRLKFRDDFPIVTTKQWEEKIQKDLKGAEYQKKLIWRTQEGFNVKPYYREEDLEGIGHLKFFPGEFPYVRSKKGDNNTWFVRQDIPVKGDYKKANRKALEILNRGVDSLGFILDENNEPSSKDFENLLEGICLSAIELNFMANHASEKVLALLLEKLKKESEKFEEIKGGTDFNPIGNLNLNGKFCQSAENSFNKSKEVIELTKNLPGYRAIEVDGCSLYNAGATAVQELGFSLAMGNEYLANLSEKELDVDTIADNIRFKFGVGPAYFIEIAKFRAARMLWAKVVEAYKPGKQEKAQMQIHAETSQWNQTIYDPYVNMLRGTTESMSATLSGVDSLTVNPYNKSFEEPNKFSERIARNTQILLKEEAYFDKVVDPAGGAYYIENLTNSIAEHAWRLFQEIEEKGGYIKAFENGFVQEKIKEVANQRNFNLAMRKEALVGVNLYPNADEVMEEGYDENTIQSADYESKDAVAEPLVPYRGAEEIETLRIKTERSGKSRPRVFLFTIGDKTMRRARAGFSSGFFAAAGFEIIDNIGFDSVEEGVKEARNKEADIVVICSSDPEYPELAPAINEQMKDDAIIVVAGYPKDSMEQLKEAGINHFVHIKSNLVETLKKFQEELGIR